MASGQTTVKVLDAHEKRPLPQAHVIVHDIEGRDQQAVIADTAGVAIVPGTFAAKNPRMVISVSYIGFRTVVDTISSGETMVYYLEAEEHSLNEVVITAQYSPNSPDKAVHKIRIIDQKKIERMAAVNLEDVLSNELNIRISQDNILGSGISMQGISGQNVKIMIDGVPVIGRQNGNIDLSQINLNDIERIEIVEGPLSVNYGTNALAGTINIITKKQSKKKTSITLNTYNETIGTYNLSGTMARQLGKARLSVTAGRNYFDGWTPGDPVNPDFKPPVADSTRNQSWLPKEQYFGRGQLNYRLKNVVLGYKLEYFDEKVINRGLPRAPYNELAFDDYYRTARMDQAVTATGKLSKSATLNAVAAYNRFNRQKNTYLKDLTTLEQQLTTTPGDQDTSAFDLWMSRGSIAVAKDSSWFHYELGYDLNHESASGRRIESEVKSMGDYALFATAEMTLLKKLTFRPGLRAAHNTAYKAPVVPSLNVRYAYRNYTFRASYARGFRAPALKELYFFFVDVNHNITGNPDLKAEYSHNFSSSVKYKRIIRQTIVQLEASTFHNDIKNLITLAFQEGTESAYSYVNIGRSRTQGINAGASLLFEHLKLNLGAAYIGLYGQEAYEASYPHYVYYPEVTSSGTYEWRKPGITVAAFYKYQGRLPGTSVDAEGNLILTYVEDYHTLDANVQKHLFDKSLVFSTGIKNLFNVQNVAATQNSGGIHAGGGSTRAISSGRLYFLKMEWRWKK